MAQLKAKHPHKNKAFSGFGRSFTYAKSNKKKSRWRAVSRTATIRERQSDKRAWYNHDQRFTPHA